MRTARQLQNLRLGPTSPAAKLARQRDIDSGRLAEMRNSEKRKNAMSALAQSGHNKRIAPLGGQIAGRINVESGQLLAAAPNGGRAGCHVRWHLKKKKINERCVYWTGELKLSERAQKLNGLVRVTE